MLILHGPAHTHLISHPQIRALAEQRFTEILDGEEYDGDIGYFIVVEPGDTGTTLEAEIKTAVVHDPHEDVHFGQKDFAPTFEALDDHGFCFEIVYILNDSGFGVEIFVPKTEGIDAELLAMCEMYSVPTQYPLKP